MPKRDTLPPDFWLCIPSSSAFTEMNFSPNSIIISTAFAHHQPQPRTFYRTSPLPWCHSKTIQWTYKHHIMQETYRSPCTPVWKKSYLWYHVLTHNLICYSPLDRETQLMALNQVFFLSLYLFFSLVAFFKKPGLNYMVLLKSLK